MEGLGVECMKLLRPDLETLGFRGLGFRGSGFRVLSPSPKP